MHLAAVAWSLETVLNGLPPAHTAERCSRMLWKISTLLALTLHLKSNGSFLFQCLLFSRPRLRDFIMLSQHSAHGAVIDVSNTARPITCSSPSQTTTAGMRATTHKRPQERLWLLRRRQQLLLPQAVETTVTSEVAVRKQ